MDHISIHGAKTHNLKDVSLDIPRDKLIVITGLSGTAKDTLESLGALDALPSGHVLPTLLGGIRKVTQTFET